MMELEEAVKGRRSVRKFKSDPVPKDVLEHILELAMWAPSGSPQSDRLRSSRQRMKMS